MIQYCLPLLLAVVISVHSQKCKEDFDNFHLCVEQSKNVNNERSYEREDKKRNEIIQCFDKEKCRAPKFDRNSNNRQPEKSNDEIDQQEENRKKRFECRKAINTKARKSVEKCVQESVPEYSLLNKTKNLFGFRHSVSSMMEQIESKCSNENARPLVKQCLEKLRKNRVKNENKENPDSTKFAPENKESKRHLENCQAKHDCRKKQTFLNALHIYCEKTFVKITPYAFSMTPACQHQYDVAQNMICECVSKKVKSEPESLAQDYDQCVGDAKEQPDEKHPLTSTVIASDFQKMCDNTDCDNAKLQLKPTGLPRRKNAKSAII